MDKELAQLEEWGVNLIKALENQQLIEGVNLKWYGVQIYQAIGRFHSALYPEAYWHRRKVDPKNVPTLVQHEQATMLAASCK
jgi:hypothetical protein